jgi:phosphatidate cytidylyltransferase
VGRIDRLLAQTSPIRWYSMKNAVKRVLLVTVAVPVLYILALYVPFLNHLPLVLIVLAFVAGSAVELIRMLEPQAGPFRILAALVFALMPPIAVYIYSVINPNAPFMYRWLMPTGAATLACFMLSGLPLAFSRQRNDIMAAARTATSNALISLYPGAMSTALVAIPSIGLFGGKLIVWYSLVVFANDSLAWLFGITLGRTRGIVAVSPKKSLEGFVAGMSGSVMATLAGPFLFPTIVPSHWFALLVTGLACGFLVIAGDLFESSIKRAVSVKDSGSIIPGRGGILDSFDSILFTAPVFAGFLVFLRMA